MAKTDRAATGAAGSPERAKRAAPGADGLLETALRLFYQFGYAGTSVRQIASATDVTVAALYHHFPAKQDILVTIMRSAMETALRDAEQAYASAEPSPPAQLTEIVSAMVRYHTRHQAEAFVGNSELRSLEKSGRSQIVALRDAHEAIVRKVISDGVDQGVFSVDSPEQAARAVIAMCVSVASWYQRNGSLTSNDVSNLYSHYALNLVGCRTDPAVQAIVAAKRGTRARA